MAIPRHAVSVESTVPFHHCDLLEVVWHGRYFEYFEAARTELMRSIDLDVGAVRELGFKMYVVDAKVRWMQPLTYGDQARCTAWFLKSEPHVRMAFDLRNLTRETRAARATMTFATTTFDGALLTEVPDVFREKLPHGLV